jgi:hypothetical protein
MKKLIFTIFAISSLCYGGEIKKNAPQEAAMAFIPVDNTERSKVSQKEINEVSAMDTKALQEKVDSIRNKVLDAKSRLIERNKEEVVQRAPLSSLIIEHKDSMSSRFSILSLTYVLDGKKIYSEYDLYRDKKDVYPVFNSVIAPGHHEILVEMVCSGSEDSAFNYLKDYRIKTQNRYSFVMSDSGKTRIEGVSYESGTIFTSFKDRPAIGFESNSENKMIDSTGK